MGKVSALIKAATVAAPVIVKVVQTYGPQLRKIAADNPALVERTKERLAGIALQGKGRGGSSLSSSIDALRDQVTYLYASANNPGVAQQAQFWRSELDHLASTLPVIDAMSASAQKTERKAVQRRIDELSRSILAATIGDDIEDADVESGDPASNTDPKYRSNFSNDEKTGY